MASTLPRAFEAEEEQNPRAPLDFARGSRGAPVIVATLVIGLIAVAMFSGRTHLAVLGAIGVVMTFVFLKYPLAGIVSFLLGGHLLDTFTNVPRFDVNYGSVGHGWTIGTVLLVIMVFISGLRLYERSRSGQARVGLVFPAMLFSALIVAEIVRGYPAHHLSSLGEFRFSFLVLAIIPYVTLSFSTPESRRRLLIALIALFVGFPLLSAPFIGALKGWAVGAPDHRYYPAFIVLGMVYGVVAWALARREGYFAGRGPGLAIVSVMVAFWLLVEGHRSVWLAAAVLAIALLVLGAVRLSRAWFWVALLLLVGAAFVVGSVQYGSLTKAYVDSRAIAFTDPTKDQTAAWRLAEWKNQLERLKGQEAFGLGFGTYYDVTFGTGSNKVQPHNVYVQLLLKVGVVGLLLYLVLILGMLYVLVRTMFGLRQERSPEVVLPLLGAAFLVSSSAFYFTYPLEPTTLMFVGLGLATCLAVADRRAESAEA